MVALSQARFLRPVCFTGAEGFARGFLSSRRATLSASLKNSANSNYSRTYVPPPGRGYTGLLVRPFPQLFCFPYLRKNRGVYPLQNVGAPTFSLSFHPISTLGPLALQSVAHSFIFRIQPISRPSNIFRTLPPKTGGTPPLVMPIISVTTLQRSSRGFFLYLIYFLYLLYLLHPRYQLPEFAHQLQPATHPLLQPR